MEYERGIQTNKMKILSPLSNIEEVKPLCNAGADQFYCGLVHEDEALNDRPNTGKFNFSSIEELSKAVKIASCKKACLKNKAIIHNTYVDKKFLLEGNKIINIEKTVRKNINYGLFKRVVYKLKED